MTELTEQDFEDLKTLSAKNPVVLKVLEMLEDERLNRYITMKSQLVFLEDELKESPIGFSSNDKKFERMKAYMDSIDKWDAALANIKKRLTSSEKDIIVDKPKKVSSQVPANLGRK